MTNKELIKQLQALPANAIVFVEAVNEDDYAKEEAVVVDFSMGIITISSEAV